MMKKIFLYTLLAATGFLNLNCGKEQVTTGPATVQEIIASIPRNATYTYNLGTYGRTNTPVIIRQPANYQVSMIRITEAGSAEYVYQPTEGFTGEDEVIIETTRETNGVGALQTVQLKIKFSVQVEQVRG